MKRLTFHVVGLGLAIGFIHPAAGQEGKPGAAKGAEGVLTKALEEAWPDRPEWLDMYTDILQGSQLGPNDGWFRRAVAQTRFDWPSTLARLDKDKDGKVSRGEFPGSDADFARLDRDRDKALTAPDFDFTPHALSPTPGMMMFMRADRDGNGKVTRDEVDAFFKAADSGGLGYLSLADMQDAFRSAPRPAPTAGAPPAQDGPSKETLIRGLFRQEIGSLQAGPALGEKATDFTLKTEDGASEVTLSKAVGPRPVVLVFGNFTCGPFRSQAGNVEKVYRMYKDRATFLMVYVREAHPTDGWAMDGNERAGASIPQPTTYDERVAVAKTCAAKLGLGFPVLVDSMNDAVGAPIQRYAQSALPDRRGGESRLQERPGPVRLQAGAA